MDDDQMTMKKMKQKSLIIKINYTTRLTSSCPKESPESSLSFDSRFCIFCQAVFLLFISILI